MYYLSYCYLRELFCEFLKSFELLLLMPPLNCIPLQKLYIIYYYYYIFNSLCSTLKVLYLCYHICYLNYFPCNTIILDINFIFPNASNSKFGNSF